MDGDWRRIRVVVCYYPIDGWRARRVNESGKRPIVFNVKDGFADMPVTLPCGQCIGCRLERSRQWAIRCVHEASLHSSNCFITLTYSDEYLPATGSVSVREFQLFMKRFRKAVSPIKLRYYMCGEYGEVCKTCNLHISKCVCTTYVPTFGRPHYHAIIFGYDFSDKLLYSVKNDNPLYVSETLHKIWGKGMCIIGAVTFESAAYVARYIMKKIGGKEAIELGTEGTTYYEVLDESTGEIRSLTPEFTTMSRRPGIGAGWYEKYKDEVFPNDLVVIRGKKMRPPKFYQAMYENEFPGNYIDLVLNPRKKEALARKEDATLNRLRDREKIKVAQVNMLKRNQEEK